MKNEKPRTGGLLYEVFCEIIKKFVKILARCPVVP
jgi:hypothetical protein